MSKTKLLIIVFLIITVRSVSQGFIDSPYSRFGVGDLINNVSGTSIGMGGSSYANTRGGFINYLNPAGLSSIDSLSFIFDFGFNGGIRNYQISNPEMSALKSDFQISNLMFGFRVTPWWASAFGFLPYSKVSYDVASYDSVLYNVNKYYRFGGDGGLNRAFFNNSFTPVKNLNVGVGFSFLYGKINQHNSINFDDDSGDYLNVLQRHSMKISDFMIDFGVQYSIDVNNKNKIHLGGVYQYNSELRGTKSSMIFNSLSSGGSAIIDTIFASEPINGFVSIPQKIGLGLAYEFNDKLIICLDYTTQDWSKTVFFGIQDSLKNSNSISLGLEYLPVGKTGYAYKYSQSVSYRAGAYFNNTYLNVNSNGDPIHDFGISFGFGLPLKRSQTSFNLGLQLGQRGTMRNDLVKENYIIFALNFNLTDRWFVKRKFD